MYLSLLLPLALAAFCTAALYGEDKRILINVDGSHIAVINNRDGRAVHINTFDFNGKDLIEVKVTGRNVLTRTIQFDDRTDDAHQSLLLAQIFNEYRGTIDETTYRHLLNTVQKYVQNDVLNKNIMLALEIIDTEDEDILKGNIFTQQIEKQELDNVVGKQILGRTLFQRKFDDLDDQQVELIDRKRMEQNVFDNIKVENGINKIVQEKELKQAILEKEIEIEDITKELQLAKLRDEQEKYFVNDFDTIRINYERNPLDQIIENRDIQMIDGEDTLRKATFLRQMQNDMEDQKMFALRQRTVTPFERRMQFNHHLNSIRRMHEEKQMRETMIEKAIHLENMKYMLKQMQTQDVLVNDFGTTTLEDKDRVFKNMLDMQQRQKLYRQHQYGKVFEPEQTVAILGRRNMRNLDFERNEINRESMLRDMLYGKNYRYGDDLFTKRVDMDDSLFKRDYLMDRSINRDQTQMFPKYENTRVFGDVESMRPRQWWNMGRFDDQKLFKDSTMETRMIKPYVLQRQLVNGVPTYEKVEFVKTTPLRDSRLFML